MFNRSFFNRATYNRLYTVEVFFSATMAGEGFMNASPSAEYTATGRSVLVRITYRDKFVRGVQCGCNGLRPEYAKGCVP
jgi:hypothetical protein